MPHRRPLSGLALEKLEQRYLLNAAPVLHPTASPELLPIPEDAGAPVGQLGTLVSDLIDSGGPLNNFSDLDGDAPGIAITGVNLQGGTLWYSVNGGVTWADVGTVSDAAPRLLAANAVSRVYFQPAAGFFGTIDDVISFKAWDQFGVLAQLGEDIDGEAAGDLSGYRGGVAISADGITVAIGAPQNDGNDTDSGHVRIYRWSGATWEQLGSDIDGEFPGDNSGNAVALSADGQTVAIGARYNTGQSGHVRVFGWNGYEWTQLGNDIDGEARADLFGTLVSLSATGRTLAVGARLNDGNGFASGSVRVFAWDGIDWRQVGEDIDGEAAGDEANHVSLSADGTTLAIGAGLNDGSFSNAGHLRIFKWDGVVWQQIGMDIEGEAAGDKLGHYPSLSADGSFVSVGVSDSTNRGRVNVYHWEETEWRQLGNSVTGSSAGNGAVWSSLSADGKTLVVGATGGVRLFRWTGLAWRQTGASIPSEFVGDQFGLGVSLSADGQTFASGATGNDENGAASGHTRVYRNAATQSSFSAATGSIGVRVQPASMDWSGSLMTLASDGRWFLAKSDGSKFDTSVYGIWNMNVQWTSILQGDIDGDGLMDVIGRTHIGQWWVTLNQGDGTGRGNQFLGYWKADMDFSDVVCGDFNGDGRDDVAGRTPSGQWWVGLSKADSLGFTNVKLARWTSAAQWDRVLTGDFNGDGRTDIAGLSDSGIWWGVLGNTDGTGEAVPLGVWKLSLGFEDIAAGDFNGDGRTDIVGRTSNGQWWAAMAKANITGFDNVLIGGWSTGTEWTSVATGDFNGDGQDDIVGRASNGQWWGLRSDGTSRIRPNTLVGYWSRNVTWTGIITGDADGDGKDDIIGRVASAEGLARGRLWVGRVVNGRLETGAWGFVSAPPDAETKSLFFGKFARGDFFAGIPEVGPPPVR